MDKIGESIARSHVTPSDEDATPVAPYKTPVLYLILHGTSHVTGGGLALVTNGLAEVSNPVLSIHLQQSAVAADVVVLHKRANKRSVGTITITIEQ